MTTFGQGDALSKATASEDRVIAVAIVDEDLRLLMRFVVYHI